MATVRIKATDYKLNAVRDTLDFRDLIFEPTLVNVPTELPLAQYLKQRVPILDQGKEGACTGYGLATVIHSLLRRRVPDPDATPVSPHMLYAMAKRYDEWPGENYEGSSARGAMKGWHKHGVCSEKLWPKTKADGAGRWLDARARPLGAYFRVNHQDLIAMHAALAEVGVLYASAQVHDGWRNVGADGQIEQSGEIIGGHAFAIVAYDRDGFWIQNSWGDDWGKGGFCHITYDDWLANGSDVWVGRLGVPVLLNEYRSTASAARAGSQAAAAHAYADLRPHIVSTGNEGLLRTTGTYGTSDHALEEIFHESFPEKTQGWPRKRLLLYAHGGLTGEEAAVQRVSDYLPTLMEAQVYPLSFIWKTDFWTTLQYMLADALGRRRPEGFLDSSKDFMLDRLDDALEPLTRALGGKAEWDEMKENAIAATAAAEGGARKVARYIAELRQNGQLDELHLVGYSAGSIYLAPLVHLLTAGPTTTVFRDARGLGQHVDTVTLWAPAITMDLFLHNYLPAIADGSIGRFRLFTLTDEAEQADNCANIYHKSLLYLVSQAFEERPHIPLVREGEPLAGMEKWVRTVPELMSLFRDKQADWIRAPNAEPMGKAGASRARSHADFDDDEATVRATLAGILALRQTKASIPFEHSRAGRRSVRAALVPLR